MKMGLAPYQKQAVDLSLKSFADGLHKISISMTASAGKTTTALSIAEEFINHHKNSNVLYLCRFRAHVEQIKHRLIEQNPKLSIATSMKTYNTEKFLITTYQNLLDTYQKDLLLNFTLVVCDDADTMKSPLYNDIFSTQKSFFVGLVSNTNIERTCWFFDSKTIFEYVYTDYVNKFYNENIAINDFIIPLLTKCHFKNINTSNFPQYKVKPDVIVEKRGEQVVFEVKTYRGIKNESQVIYSAVQHVKEIRRGLEPDTTTKTKFGIIMFCDVNEKLKQELIKQNSIFIWDIKNLMYICNGDEELLGRLAKLVPYPINDINPVVPIDDLNAIISNQSNQLELSHILSEGETLVERLNNCKYGKKDNSAVLYEEVCNDVI